jgi:hypothetical protein
MNDAEIIFKEENSNIQGLRIIGYKGMRQKSCTKKKAESLRLGSKQGNSMCLE